MKFFSIAALALLVAIPKSALAASWQSNLAQQGFSVGWESYGPKVASLDGVSDVKIIVRSLESADYTVLQEKRNLLVIPKTGAVTNVQCSLSSKGITLGEAVDALREQTGVPIFTIFLPKEITGRLVDVNIDKRPLNEALSEIAKSAGFATWLIAPLKSKNSGRFFFVIEFR